MKILKIYDIIINDEIAIDLVQMALYHIQTKTIE